MLKLLQILLYNINTLVRKAYKVKIVASLVSIGQVN